jgi:uncharacterized repeat protein (TIGR01451 family)
MPTKESQSLVLVSKQNGFVVIPAATPLTRLNYFDGKFLRASDLKTEQDYLRQLVRQSNQAGGAGVAHGFDVTLGGGDVLNIRPGLAIDAEGRVLLLPQGSSVGVQELIDKSRNLQRLYGKTNVIGAGNFEACEMTAETPAVNLQETGALYVVVVSAAEALCGVEDVYGKLCEEACATSTDRPFAVEGVVVRAIPLVLKSPYPSSKAAPPTQVHLRSRVASAYFADERNVIASLISAEGLKQTTWCLGADAAVDGGVPIGVIARAGATTVFLDPWMVRRELIDTPARRYWQSRMMMRPWDVFLAQILQFQCQLRDLFRQLPTLVGETDPCGGAHGVIREAADTISELKQFYESTVQRFTVLNVNLEEAITYKGGISRLTALNDKLVSVGQGLTVLPKDRFLIHGGIVELPSAGYLPVVPGAANTINQQVRRLLGEGVDLRFCVVRPDYVAHALEEAQHMERISLLQGLDNPKDKPEVDILVPNGEVLDQKLLSPGNGFEASVDLNYALISAPTVNSNLGTQSAVQTMNFRGAARAENLATGGGAFYLSCDHQVNLYTLVSASLESAAAVQPIETARSDAALRATATTAANEVEAVANPPLLANTVSVGPIEYQLYQPPRLGLWISLRCDSNIFKLGRGDTANFNARAMVANTNGKALLLDVQLNGVIQITQEARTSGSAQSVSGHIENAQLSFSGVLFGNTKTNILIDLDVVATLTGGSAIEILLKYATNAIVLSANWGSGPLAVSAEIVQKLSGNAIRPPQAIALAHANLKDNPDVLSAKNASHLQALASLEIIGKILSDANFADAKARLLFPPPAKPTDELIVRGTTDWVLFHRRRTRRCSQEICVPPVAPQREYQVYHLPLANLQELNGVRQKLIEGNLPESSFNKLPFVDFAGGAATLLTNPEAWRGDWANIQPGNSIVYASIANRASAAADGDTLALSRLEHLVAAVAPVSTPNAQMQVELLTQIPNSIPASNVDGVIFLFSHKAADLRIVKSATPSQVTAGENITYTLTLINLGPMAAQNVVLTDAVPLNTTFLSARVASGTGWTQTLPAVGATGNVVFSKASVAVNETTTFEIVVKTNVIPGALTTSIVNTATVISPTRDPNLSDNTSSTTTPVAQPQSADLRITKTVAPVQFTAGGDLTYTLTSTNLGPTTAQNVRLNDPLPANTTFVSAQAPAGWTSTLPPVGGTGSVIFRKASVAVAETATFQIVVRVNVSAAGVSIPLITNTATVESSTTDPLLSNNTATAFSTLSQPPPSADLSITKSAPPGVIFVGEPVSYRLTVRNAGPSVAQNVTAQDVLPAGTRFVSVGMTGAPGWTATTPPVGSAGTVRFTKATLGIGETAVFEIVIRAASSGTVSNRATVESATPDPNSANNVASVNFNAQSIPG